jgi:hypothetical protein
MDRDASGQGQLPFKENHPYHWDVVAEPRLQVDPGLHTAQAARPYVMWASEEASFAKAFRRSPRVIGTGQLR